MDPNVSSYRNIVIGDLADGRQAVYLDGVSGTNRYTTEILVYDGGQYTKPFVFADGRAFLY